MSSSPIRVCVIGAGPSGMAFLYNFAKLRPAQEIELVCYEKQSDVGGQWNLTWRTGTDEYGEVINSSMYSNLWINAPKEAIEFPDYTFDHHFGKTQPSFLPREPIRDYLMGRFNSRGDLKKSIKFKMAVRNVQYKPDTDDFKVSIWDLEQSIEVIERFDFVIAASGIFSTPNFPNIAGIDGFTGDVIHCHSFRHAKSYEGKRVLLVGSSFSAEDIAFHLNKFGAKHVIIAWRTKEVGFNWPSGIEERPHFQRVQGNTAIFKDGSTAEVDTVIFCTGYLNHYPFLSGDLQLVEDQSFFPEHLYKGIVWTNGGNNKLLYIGAQLQIFSMPVFDAQAVWAIKYITGQLVLPDKEAMLSDIKAWVEKKNALTEKEEFLDFQETYIEDLWGERLPSIRGAKKVLYAWMQSKKENFCTFRDQVFASPNSGTMASVPKVPYSDALVSKA